MIINIAFPYSTRWRKAYIQTNSEGRKTVILYNSPSDRSSTSLARYVMAISEGRFLRDDEHVDHDNDDETDDRLSNLKILSQLENNRKIYKPKGEFRCIDSGTVLPEV